MADDDIGAEKMGRYIESKAKSFRCPACNSLDWILDDEQDGRSASYARLERNSPDIMGAPITFTLSMFCSACGFQASFSRKMVSKWLNENPA